jgi:hypothetical protein
MKTQYQESQSAPLYEFSGRGTQHKRDGFGEFQTREGVAERVGFGLSPDIKTAQVIDFTKSQKR